MMPKIGDIVRLSSELFDALESVGDVSWAPFKGHVLKVINLSPCMTETRVEFERVDGERPNHIHFINVHDSGYKWIDRTQVCVFVEAGEHRSADIPYCACKDPEFVSTGIGSLSFDVCRKCKRERK